MVVLVTALIFFDHLRIYNQILFLYASNTMGGFESDTIPDHMNLRDRVFFPVMETLGLTLIGDRAADHHARLRRGARARHRRAAAHHAPHRRPRSCGAKFAGRPTASSR